VAVGAEPWRELAMVNAVEEWMERWMEKRLGNSGWRIAVGG
jgi:hypothetical protein